MKHKKVIVSLIGAGFVLGSFGQSFAQEQQQNAVPAQVVSDGGVEAVREAQEMKVPPAEKKFKKASTMLTEIVKKKGWRIGWDKKKKRYIVIGQSLFESADPATDKNFLVLRDMAVKRAILEAKAKIIEFCNTTMDAMDMVHTPGTDLNKALNRDLVEIEANLVRQKEELAKLLAKYNQAEADALRGTTFADRLDDLMAALIKKLDKEYNANAHDEKLQAKLLAVKEEFEGLKKRIAQMEKKAQALKGNLARTQKSEIATYAAMPLYGAVGLMQTESWDGKMYQVAIALCWSNALERSARAIVTGEAFHLKPKADGKSIDEWLAAQNLATMSGTRQFLDKDGNRWFIGISARSSESSLNEIVLEKNKAISEMAAKSLAVFSVWGDVESFKLAKQELRSYEKGDALLNNVVESMEKKLTQVIAGKTIRGLQEIASEETAHPICGNDIYVCVYGIDAASARDALQVETVNYATKIFDERHQSEELGRDAANQAAVKAATNRPEDIQRGAMDQASRLNREFQKRTAAPRKGTAVIQKPAAPAKTGTKKSTSGSFSGDADVNDDF